MSDAEDREYIESDIARARITKGKFRGTTGYVSLTQYCGIFSPYPMINFDGDDGNCYIVGVGEVKLVKGGVVDV